MPNKYQWYVGSLILLVLASTACASSPAASDEIVTVIPSAATPMSAADTQTPEPILVSAQNNLTLVEFFAGA